MCLSERTMEAIHEYLSSPSDAVAAQKLFARVPLDRLLTLAWDSDHNPQVIDALDRIFSDPSILYQSYVSLGLPLVQSHASHPSSQSCLFRHISKLPISEGLALGDQFLSLVLSSLSTGETAIVEPVTTWLVVGSKTEAMAEWLRSECALSGLIAGLRLRNETNKVRYCDLLVRLATASAGLFEVYRQTGLVEEFLAMYQTKDILLKLALIEVVAKMGDAPHTIQYLVRTETMRTLSEEMENDRSDDYVRGELLILFAKLFSSTCDLPLLSGRYWQVFHSYIAAQDLSHYNKGTTALCFIAERTEGVGALVGRDTILRTWFEAARSTVVERRIGFYVALAHVIQHSSLATAQGLFARLPTFAGGKSIICKELTSPFLDLVPPVLGLVVSITRFPWGVSAVFGEPELAEFLLKRNSKQSSEVCLLKFNIVEAAHKSEVQLTQLLRARIAEYVSGGVYAPAFGQLEEAMTENIN